MSGGIVDKYDSGKKRGGVRGLVSVGKAGALESYVALAVFTAAYILFVALPGQRWVVGLAGLGILLAAGVMGPVQAFWMVNWNVMGVFVGTLVLAELFVLSEMPAYVAERMLRKSPNAAVAMVGICVLTGVISMVAENVATVLIVAPVAMAMARKLKVSPIPLMVGVAVSSNLQGAATLIGDPPSMILAAYSDAGHRAMNFMDFFWYQGRPSIFFAIQAGAVASTAVLYLMFRRYRQAVKLEVEDRYSSVVPTVLLGALIALLVVSSYADPDFIYLAGTVSAVCAGVGLIWHWGKKEPLWPLLRKLDWQTTIFLGAVFIIVGGVQATGWMEKVVVLMRSLTGGNALLTFAVIVGFSVVVSAFVDNVPFLAAMVYVAGPLANDLGQPPALLLFGLLIGASLGGNITPIGASANIVACGYLGKNGYHVKFWEFVRVGLPFTLAAVGAASVFVWLIWGRV